MEQDRPGRATTRRRSAIQAGASHDTGTQTLPGHGRGGGAAAALAPHWAAAPRSRPPHRFLMRSATRNGANGSAARNMRCCGAGHRTALFQSAEQRAPQGYLYTCAGCAHKLFSSDRKFDSSQLAQRRRGRDRGPHLRHGPHGGALRQLRRPSGTRVRRRPAPDRPALLHERRRAALHGAEETHAPPHPQTIGSIAMPASFLSRKLPGLLTAACPSPPRCPGLPPRPRPPS